MINGFELSLSDVTGRLLDSDLSSTPIDNIKGYLNKIHSSAHRMHSLLNGIAEYSMSATSDKKFEQVDLNNVIEEVLKDLEMQISEKNARILTEELATIEAVRIQMYQVFLNIINNAIKYSKKDVPPEILVRCADFDSFVEITISDNGIGFNDRYAEKAFLPFHRLHSGGYEGSGIGLAICKKIVEIHGGTIRVKSIPGDGSQFIFTLEKIHGDMLAYQ